MQALLIHQKQAERTGGGLTKSNFDSRKAHEHCLNEFRWRICCKHNNDVSIS